MSSTGGMTFLYLPISTRANHTPEDMKVAVLKAGLANQEYRKKQEILLISKYGTVAPSGLNLRLWYSDVWRALVCNRALELI